MDITPVILAAGDSTRMGYPKALLPFRGRTFLTHILETLKTTRLDVPLIILGREAGRIEKVISAGTANLLVNPDPSRGQLSSMQLAISNLGSRADACMFWPVDQPDVSEALILDLVKCFRESGASIAMPVFRGRRGHPAIFGRGLWGELLNTPPDEGPKRVVMSREPALLECSEPGTVTDADTPADYFALTGITLQEALISLRPCGES